MNLRRDRLADPPRLAGVDLARALAVGGMFAAHLTLAPAVAWGDPATWWGVVGGRSSVLFALLAGLSIALVTGGVTPQRGAVLAASRARLAARGGILWALGIALLALGVPVYVILPAYGLLFVLALPLLGLRAPALLAVAAALGLTMPFVVALADAGFAAAFEGEFAAHPLAALLGWWYPFPVWLAYVSLGMAVGRMPLRALRTGLLLLAGGVGLAVVGYGSAALFGITEGQPPLARTPAQAVLAQAFEVGQHSGGVFEVFGSSGFALAVLALCLLACRLPPLRAVFWPLRAVGSMPLTIYVGQLLAWVVVALAAGFSPSDLFAMIALAPLGWFIAGAIAFAVVWVLTLGRGPLETLLAKATAPFGAIAAPPPRHPPGS